VEWLEAAVLRTVLYADIFSFPMTVTEIHHFLISDQPASREQVEATIHNSGVLQQWLCAERGYVVYGAQQHLVDLRLARESASAQLWLAALRYGRWLARLPFVRMVALTGALAMHNAASEDDDLDYLVITKPGRVWLARAFIILLVRLARLRGVTLCPNYIVAENNLSQPDHNIFLAHEITQMIPLYNRDLYRKLRAANAWSQGYLPNAREPFIPVDTYWPGWGWRTVKGMGEFLLSGWPGDQLEQWEYRRKLHRFAPDMQTPHSAARLDETQVKGHFNDHGHPALRRYHERLRACGLADGD
jgi:hypothetical protein